MRTLALAGAAAIVGVVGFTPAHAQTGFAVRGGTLGPGLEVAHHVGDRVALRAGGSYLPLNGMGFTLEDDAVDVDFEADARVASFYLLADFFPVALVHLTAGAVHHRLDIDVLGAPAGDYSMEGRTFTRDQIGSLTATAEYERSLSPYVGLGLGDIAMGRVVGLTLDGGVIFSGSLQVDLQGTDMLEPTGEQGPVIQEALDGVRIYPVLSLGLAIRP